MYLGKKGDQLNSEDFSDEPGTDEPVSAETEDGPAIFDRGCVADDETASEIEADEEARTEQDEAEADIQSPVRQPAGAKRDYRLTRVEERKLIARVQSGEEGAVDALIAEYQGFLFHHIAKRYGTWSLDPADKMTCARLGLVDAAKRFDLCRDTRLTTYAAWCIRAKFSETVERDGLVAAKVVKRSRKIRRVEEEEERTNFVGGNVWTVHGDVSLDAPIGNDEDGETRSGYDSLEYSDNGEWVGAVENSLDATKQTALVRRAEKALNSRERFVFRARFADPPETYHEIGKKLGFSGERARQIEAAALKKIATEIKSWRDRHNDSFFPCPSFGPRPTQTGIADYWKYLRRLHNRWPQWPTRVWRPDELGGKRPGACYSTPRLAWMQRSSAWPRSEGVAA